MSLNTNGLRLCKNRIAIYQVLPHSFGASNEFWGVVFSTGSQIRNSLMLYCNPLRPALGFVSSKAESTRVLRNFCNIFLIYKYT